ncbi:hypothetical protein ACWDA3_59160 [Nonomuraea rubra]
MYDIQISVTGKIAYQPRFFPASSSGPAMWSAKLEVAGPPTPGRDGSTYVPTRHIEVVTYGLAAVRAEESFHVGQVLTVQACDVVARSYETKDRQGRTVVRSIVKIIATSIGLSVRYNPVQQGAGAWPAGGSSPRMAQGAATPTTCDEAVPAA